MAQQQVPGASGEQKKPLSGAKGLGIVVGAMFGIIGVLWLVAWLAS